MQYIFRDINPAVVDAWRRDFTGCGDVTIAQADIFETPADAIVSPANSFGFMDGGIDLLYSRRFGWGLQERLQALLRAEHDGELPVGQAAIVETGDPQFPLLVSAPTMRVPMDVSDTVNAFLAFRAVIRAVRAHNRTAARPVATVVTPGLGTAIGRLPARACASQMLHAYRTSHLGEIGSPAELIEAALAQYRMVR